MRSKFVRKLNSTLQPFSESRVNHQHPPGWRKGPKPNLMSMRVLVIEIFG